MTGSFYGDSIIGRLERHAGEYPDHTAYTYLREQGPPETLTFGQLAKRVRSIAARLRERLRPCDRAVLCTRRVSSSSARTWAAWRRAWWRFRPTLLAGTGRPTG